MDLATIIGLVMFFVIFAIAIGLGGNFGLFVNIPGLLIVFGGTIAVALIRVSTKQFMSTFTVALKAVLRPTNKTPFELIEESIELAKIARKQGMLALEDQEISHPFLNKGIQLCIDGYPPETVSRLLSKEIDLTIERHETGYGMFKAIGDYAPAMGMIGTLIGLVQMLAFLDDAAAIGPAMAVALLTTLYGAMLANGVALPLSEKLQSISEEERLIKDLIMEAIASIQSGINPKAMEQLLLTYIPVSQRQGEEGEEED